MITCCADIQIVGKFTVKQHGAAFVAFRPKVFGGIAARKDRVDPWADIVCNPVHGRAFITILVYSLLMFK